jgi:Xaa-Pro aminopeptidase
MPQNNNILKLLRGKLRHYDLDGFLIPSVDEFQNEYVPDHLNRLKFISGFTGSNGIALITLSEAFFFTDGRYLLQAKQELDKQFKIINITRLFETTVAGKIGYDPKLHSASNIAKYKHLNLLPFENLIDLIWEYKPVARLSQVFSYLIKYAGESSSSKCNKLKNYLQMNTIDSLIITDSASICWLLNIRAQDVEYNPILLSYLILHQNGNMELFSNAKIKHKGLENYSPAELSNRLKLIANKKVQLDPTSTSSFISNHFSNKILQDDPCMLSKAIKNEIEIKQARKVHIIDGIAICKFLQWLENNIKGQSEISITEKLLELRKKHKDFIYPSFATIAGFVEHGAIIHYKATENSNKQLLENGLLLLDSGGQYFGGTTDITRVIPIGKVDLEQKLNFTLVLKGHIALAQAKFPGGTSGAELDILARQYLWQHGKDYAHGTGHGVGSCLSVHEGPQRIGKMGTYPLKPGMIISNEPGFYKNGEYGIRIENLMLVIKSSNDFLCMETLSLAPIEKSLILKKLLSNDEKEWLNSYHQKVYKKIAPHLDAKEKAWLKRKTISI